MRYSEEALQTVRETRALINRYDEWLFEEIQPYLGQRVLEIGCGLGNLLWHLKDREFVLGIDNSAEAVSYARNRYISFENIDAEVQDITNPEISRVSRFQFDSAVSLNVFEHIENDLLALENTRGMLKSNGVLVLIVPAHEWLYGTMDEAIGHYRRYSKETLKSKLEPAGFEVIRQDYINLLGVLGWWVNGRLLKKSVPPSGQLKIYNRIVPIWKTLEALISTPIGISLISISRAV